MLDQHERCQGSEQQAADEIRADQDLPTGSPVGEDREPGGCRGRDGESNERDDPDCTDAVGLVGIHGNGKRRGAVGEIRRRPGELESPQITIAKDPPENLKWLGEPMHGRHGRRASQLALEGAPIARDGDLAVEAPCV